METAKKQSIWMRRFRSAGIIAFGLGAIGSINDAYGQVRVQGGADPDVQPADVDESPLAIVGADADLLAEEVTHELIVNGATSVTYKEGLVSSIDYVSGIRITVEYDREKSIVELGFWGSDGLPYFFYVYQFLDDGSVEIVRLDEEEDAVETLLNAPHLNNPFVTAAERGVQSLSLRPENPKFILESQFVQASSGVIGANQQIPCIWITSGGPRCSCSRAGGDHAACRSATTATGCKDLECDKYGVGGPD